VAYVTFKPGANGPSSDVVGMKGSQQFVFISANTTKGNLIHEIGHVIGLFHEQSREDRDTYITIVKDNIEPTLLSQFNKQKGVISTTYDYNSIMHYSKYALR
jgi:hypothetical protein